MYSVLHFLYDIGIKKLVRKTENRSRKVILSADKNCYVLSKTRIGTDENVEYFNKELKDLITERRQ